MRLLKLRKVYPPADDIESRKHLYVVWLNSSGGELERTPLQDFNWKEVSEVLEPGDVLKITRV